MVNHVDFPSATTFHLPCCTSNFIAATPRSGGHHLSWFMVKNPELRTRKLMPVFYG